MSSVPSTLAAALRNGRAIPFVGAGVSMAVEQEQNGVRGRLFPSWRELLVAAANRLDAERRMDYAQLVRALLAMSPPRFLQAAQEAQAGLGPNWYRFLQQLLDPPRSRALPTSLELARAVWRLGSKLVITTNYDRVLEWAVADPLSVRHWSIGEPDELVAFMRGDNTSPAVWHLHGMIDHVKDLILTPDGYSTLYPSDNSVRVAHEAALLALRSHLVTHTLIFVGFSFSDDQFGSQLRWVERAFLGTAGPHYVIVRRAEAESTAQRLAGLALELLVVDDHGQPMLELMGQLADCARLPSGEEPPPPVGYRLRFVKGPHAGLLYDVRSDRKTTIGRSSSADLRLDRDDTVSYLHATIVAEPSGLVLADGGAANKTYVNRQAIRRVQLRDRDRVVIGSSMFIVEAVGPPVDTQESEGDDERPTRPTRSSDLFDIDLDVDVTTLTDSDAAELIVEESPTTGRRLDK